MVGATMEQASEAAMHSAFRVFVEGADAAKQASEWEWFPAERSRYENVASERFLYAISLAGLAREIDANIDN
jgi:hypothetical protein